jgi:hypothetical protein
LTAGSDSAGAGVFDGAPASGEARRLGDGSSSRSGEAPSGADMHEAHTSSATAIATRMPRTRLPIPQQSVVQLSHVDTRYTSAGSPGRLFHQASALAADRAKHARLS